jgi:hypothetical protein
MIIRFEKKGFHLKWVSHPLNEAQKVEQSLAVKHWSSPLTILREVLPLQLYHIWQLCGFFSF